MASQGSLALLNEEEVGQLPKEIFWETRELFKWQGFWYSDVSLQGMLAFQSHYEARSDDVILASSVKAGTTWLKALCFCIINGRNQIDDDLLATNNPHAQVKSLEYQLYRDSVPDDLSGMPSPRVFHTHVPYSALPDSIKNSECKIIYIARNPKDTLVSSWHFFNKAYGRNEEPYPFEKAYTDFCKGVHHYGPFLDHVLEYWSESLKMPQKILFLKYEDLKKDPKQEVRKLAAFLGRPFVNEDELDKVIWKASLERLKNLEVNKNGTVLHWKIPNKYYFRLGVVGDWKNYLTPEMEQSLDELTQMKLEGSGLDFETLIFTAST